MSNEVHYGMVIDTEHCVGCQTCTISCKISNEVPGSAHWNHLESLDGDVLYQATGTFPRTRLAFRPMLCNHCEDPACVKHCPTHAMHKDAETGLVLVDQDRCIACGYCTWTCPYGAPSMDDVHHIMSKCTFCSRKRVFSTFPRWVRTRRSITCKAVGEHDFACASFVGVHDVRRFCGGRVCR